jgi:GT2 family glycosyltransferase
MYPTVSIVVPTYNRSNFIEKTFSSLVNQDYPKDQFEIIVVDDGSSDGTTEILERFKRDYPFFQYLSQSNKGPATARNLGIQHAQGEIILFMDDDCIADKSWVKELVRGYEDQQAGGVAGLVKYVPPNNNISNQFAAQAKGAGPEVNARGELDFFVTANASFRRAVLNQVGGFDETFPHAAHEDVDLSYRVRQAGWKLLYCERAIVDHYHSHNLKSNLRKWYRIGNSEVLFQLKHGLDVKLWSGILQSLISFPKFPFAAFRYLRAGLGVKRSLAFPLIPRLHNVMVISGKLRGYFSYRNSFEPAKRGNSIKPGVERSGTPGSQ